MNRGVDAARSVCVEMGARMRVSECVPGELSCYEKAKQLLRFKN